MVPIVDLSRRATRHAPAYQDAVQRVLRSGQFLLGPEVAAFEAELAAACGMGHAVAVSSGAAALQLSLAVLGIGPGDEVIVPAFTAVPTAAAVRATGAVPVWVDVDPGMLEQMLPMLAMLVAGYMSRQGGASSAPASSGGDLGGLLGGLLGGGGQATGQAGAGGLASMLDLDGDGNPLDDILGMAGGFLR